MAQARTGPLSGVRIIDLTTVVMGPMATRILGDLGADVIRVDAPVTDLMRNLEPKRSPGMSGVTLNLHRNKRSILLDLKTDPGRQALLDLAATSNAVVTNIRAAALDKLGVGPEQLTQVRPDLVYCAAVGFGSDGPYAGRAAYDDVIQAMSGLASMFAWRDDTPAFIPSIVADKIAATHIAYAAVAALYHQLATGQGQVVEIPMAETMAAFNLVEHLNGHTFEPQEGGFSYERIRSVHRRPRRTKDGWICLLPYSTENYRDFFAFVGRPEMIECDKFSTINARIANVDELYASFDEFAAMYTTAEWLEFCAAHSIPCAPVEDLVDLEANEHFAAVGLFDVEDHPTEGTYRVIKDPISFAATPSATVGHHAPRPGDNTAEVMAELGWTQDQISNLSVQEVIR